MAAVRPMMARIGAVIRAFYELFVDDGSLAAALVVWIVAAAVALPRLGLEAPWRAAVLFAGCLLLFLENVTRTGRKRGR